MPGVNLTYSELRTEKTKKAEGLRVAKFILDGIALIRDNLPRGSEEYKQTNRCYIVAETACKQQEAALEALRQKSREVGRGRDKKNEEMAEYLDCMHGGN